MADDGFQDWIGRRRTVSEPIAPRILSHFKATLAGHLHDAPVPPGLFWCLFPDVMPPDQLGADGHVAPGLTLPELPLPRRMWAGGALTFHAPLDPGATVERTSTLTKVSFKDGATGRLGFVTLEHSYAAGGAVAVAERQDIVYRAAPAPASDRDRERDAGDKAPPPAAVQETRTPLLARAITPDPILLFRFSALTFNAHRIHYDLPYATGVEAYDGLVVHGPLQAILLMNLAADVLGRLPRDFTYRGVAPLIAGRPVRIEAFSAADGTLELQVRLPDGPVTMKAQAG
jgi:3-methylfumaryl-CoA hydratase